MIWTKNDEETAAGFLMARTIADKAATKNHRLGAGQVAGDRPVSGRQYDAIMRYLSGCPDLGVTREEDMGRARTHADVEAVTRETISDIPAGFFATVSRTGANDLDFWKVTEGRKPGFRFVKRVVGGGDTRYPRLIEISRGEQMSALGAILRTGIDKARNDYADNQERCMRCGLHLTDDASRARRMGDTCASKS